MRHAITVAAVLAALAAPAAAQRMPDFATLDRGDGYSKLGLDLAWVSLDTANYDSALHLELHGQFVSYSGLGLYLSTLCRSAVGAMVVSFPTIAIAFTLARMVQDVLFFALRGPNRRLNVELYDALQPPLAMAVGLVALLVWLAFLNHRTADRSASRTARQGLVFAGYLIATHARSTDMYNLHRRRRSLLHVSDRPSQRLRLEP